MLSLIYGRMGFGVSAVVNGYIVNNVSVYMPTRANGRPLSSGE